VLNLVERLLIDRNNALKIGNTSCDRIVDLGKLIAKNADISVEFFDRAYGAR